MKDVVNTIYTVLLRLDDRQFGDRLAARFAEYTHKWDEPEFLENWFAEDYDPEKRAGKFPADPAFGIGVVRRRSPIGADRVPADSPSHEGAELIRR